VVRKFGWDMLTLLAAEQIPASAHVGINWFVDPSNSGDDD